jgi:hypothetical protein
LENLPSGAHLSVCFSHRARAHVPGFLLRLERMLSAVRLKPPPLPPYPIWSEATVALFSSSLLQSLPLPESGPPLKQAIRMALPPLPSSSNRLVGLAPGRGPIERLSASRTEHVAPELLSSPGHLTVRITERSPLMLMTDVLLRHRRRPHHPERAALPGPSKPPRRRSECAAPPPPCLRVRVHCCPPSPIAPAPRCHLRTSRQCPGVHLDVTPSSHCQGRAALCRHQAATTLHERVCAAGAESALPVPLLPCLPSPCRVQGVQGNA